MMITDRIKVIIILKRLISGGVETRMFLMAKHMDKGRFDVHVAALVGGGEMEEKFKAEDIPFHIFSFPESPISVRMPFEVFKLVHWLNKMKPHVVLSSVFWAEIYGTLAAALNRVPAILSGRGEVGLTGEMRHQYFAGFIKQYLASFIRRFANLFVHAFVANSHASARSAIHDECLPSRKVHVIHGGVDTKKFKRFKTRQCGKQDIGLSKHSKVVCIIANLWPVKRHQDLIRAFSGIYRRVPECRLLIVGRDCGTDEQCKELANSLGIAEKVYFLGPRSDICELLQAADVGVLCSESEGFSNAILENMAANIPMVVTDTGGNPEAIRNNVNGFVVRVGDLQNLERSVVELLENDELRIQMGTTGRRIVEQYFSVELMTQRFESLFIELLSGNQKPNKK